MRDRFSGPEGRRLLTDALRQQRTLLCSESIVSALVAVANVANFPKGRQLMIQGSVDNRLAFILSGRVDVLVNGVKVAERGGGQHVGEMSVIDPTARRSATVIARETTWVAWVDEKNIARIAKKHPELWRELAVELAARLRQRGDLVRAPNAQPHIFIGSSSEALPIVKSIKRPLASDPVVVKCWNQGVFGASEATIESLEAMAREADFAVLVLTADDLVRSRKRQQIAPRDNVVFELGLFMGAIGRPRTFMLVEQSKKQIRVPPDLEGLTYLRFSRANRKSLTDAARQIRSALQGTVRDVADLLRWRI